MNLFLIFLVIGVGGYLDTTKVDNDTLQALIENATAERAQIRADQQRVLGELSGLAVIMIGEKSFNGHAPEKYPPQQYILDCDNCADHIPAGGYDSCIVGIITDTSMTRVPWYCYGDNIDEFR